MSHLLERGLDQVGWEHVAVRQEHMKLSDQFTSVITDQ